MADEPESMDAPQADVPAGAPRRPTDYAAVVLVASAVLSLAGVLLFAFATADIRQLDATGRFRQLGQAANPGIAMLAVASIAIVVWERAAGRARQAADAASLGLATAVNLFVALLAANGLVIDVTTNTTTLFRISAVISRLGTIALAAFGVWLGATAPRRP